jgi:hypothetical protein
MDIDVSESDRANGMLPTPEAGSPRASMNTGGGGQREQMAELMSRLNGLGVDRSSALVVLENSNYDVDAAEKLIKSGFKHQERELVRKASLKMEAAPK